MLALYDPFGAERALRGPLFDPLAPFRALDRLLGSPALGVPPIDVIETDDAVELVADMPGVRQEDVEVEVKDGSVVLRGRRAAEGYESTFYRSFHLRDGYALDAASASLENGVLRVRIPKGAASAPKRVAVHAPEPGEPPSPGDKPDFLERAKRALLGVARRKTN